VIGSHTGAVAVNGQDGSTGGVTGSTITARDDGLLCNEAGLIVGSNVPSVGAGMVVMGEDCSVVGEVHIDGFVYSTDGTTPAASLKLTWQRRSQCPGGYRRSAHVLD
jgi:hypothetical protein